MEYKIEEIAKIINARIIGQFDSELKVSHVETDSRYISYPSTSIFFALEGQHTNGDQFIPELAETGVRVFVSHHLRKAPEKCCILLVKNSLTALQKLAIAHRNQFAIPVIGITGSNGKTTVKEWLSQILQNKLQVCKNPKSYNSQIGVALSILELEKNHEIAIFEAGISQKSEMPRLEAMIQPDFGIFTNIGDAHESGFKSQIEKLREKIKLFKSSNLILYCGDHEAIHNILRKKKNTITWGHLPHNEIVISRDNNPNQTTSLNFSWKNISYSFNLPFTDSSAIENALHAIITSIHYKIDSSVIQETINRFHGLKLRLEQKEGLYGCVLINDSYSLDLKSLKLAFQFVDQQNQNLKRSLVISDFAARQHDISLFKEIAHLLKQFGFSRVVAIGNRIKKLKAHLPESIHFLSFSSTEEFLKSLDEISFKNECILIKGARNFTLEKFFTEFALSRHDSILEINLKAIAHNISVYKSCLNKKTKIMAVVKASAYGSGQYEIARYLEHRGIDYLAVAYTDEGVLLRQKGIQKPIMVMNTGNADFDELLSHRLEPEIFSIDQLRRFIKETDQHKQCIIHLKLETGMNRLGFQQKEVEELNSILKLNPYIKIGSIFSHLSGSSDAEWDEFTNAQYKTFKSFAKMITSQIGYIPLLHILNSSGIARHPNMQLDMVRLGIGMYGIESDPNVGGQLEKVHILKTKITQIKNIAKDESISYNRSGKLNKDSQIAVLSLGYADGLPRIAGTKKYKMWMHGKEIPIVGVVCMDMCMVDISNCSEAKVGDEVEVFGNHIPIENIAKVSETIPYEILCGIAPRVKRIFLED
jgi:alanine racemase